MEKEMVGIVVSVKKQWWLKINTKAFRTHPLDGAIFPHIIRVKYTVNGREYTKRKWIRAGDPVPSVGSTVNVIYPEEKPAKGRVRFSFLE